ncbi:MAG: hypothetical protein H0V89_13200 [Deltaproteobacteria bacterium]|nr:hypothetical protein [Deltaproteobacteria bacterium]
MTVSRGDLASSLSMQDGDALRAILLAADLPAPAGESPRALAERITTAIWWNWQTPLGFATLEPPLESVVADVARKLRVYVPGDAAGFEMIAELTKGLLADLNRRGIRMDDLSPEAQARLGRRWAGTAGLGAGAAGSGAARWGSGKLLAWMSSPIGRWLPFLPKVGPWFVAIRTGAGAVHLVAGPLGIALAVLSVNHALGTNYRRLVPLLLGVGAMRPSAVADAEEIAGAGQRPGEA